MITNSPTPNPMLAKEEALLRFISYKRHATGVALMWAIFTCGYVVLNVIVFIQPQWIGRMTPTQDYPGYIGLWERCQLTDQGAELNCTGSFGDFPTIKNNAFEAATFFVGVSCLLIFLCIFLFLLFFFIRHSIVYVVCGVLQFVSGIFMFLGCIIFPAGWNSSDVQNICGSESDQYYIDDCQVGWAYILAMVGIFDAFFLGILAFVLAARQADWPENSFSSETYSHTADLNNAFNDDVASLRPAMFVQPSPAVDPDRNSEFSHSTKRSRRSDFAL